MTDEPKNLGGRPPHVPTAATRKQVLTLSGYGVPQVEIAQTIGISKPTLQAHYRAELDAGITQANAKVAEFFGEAPSNAKACALTTDPNYCAGYHADDEAYWSNVYYWNTPQADCGDDRGNTCKTYEDWRTAWTEIKG